MEKVTRSKLLSLILTSSLITSSNIRVEAATNLDFNNNGIIDATDLSSLATNYNLKNIDSKWDSKYDLNSDNIIDVFDLAKVSKAIGTVTPVLTDSTDITSNFINANFKTEVYKLINKNSPEPILYGDVNKITELNLSSKNINNLSGIEYFTALTNLSCNSNQLTTLDLSGNTALTWISCNYNQLTTLNTSKNLALGWLSCDSNKLTTLNISSNTALTGLSCNSNQLKTLDTSKNVAVTWLSCYNNKLINLDVSKLTGLTFLSCDSNQLTTLDVSKNTLLTGLNCYYNQLTTLDVSKNTLLTRLNCYYNQLTTLYSIKDTWDAINYKSQYTDSTHTQIIDSLVITIKN